MIIDLTFMYSNWQKVVPTSSLSLDRKCALLNPLHEQTDEYDDTQIVLSPDKIIYTTLDSKRMIITY